MAISFAPLKNLLKDRGISKTKLKNDKAITGSAYTIVAKAMKTPIAEGLSISTINGICKYLDCQPGDILEYVPDKAEGQEGKTK